MMMVLLLLFYPYKPNILTKIITYHKQEKSIVENAAYERYRERMGVIRARQNRSNLHAFMHAEQISHKQPHNFLH